MRVSGMMNKQVRRSGVSKVKVSEGVWWEVCEGHWVIDGREWVDGNRNWRCVSWEKISEGSEMRLFEERLMTMNDDLNESWGMIFKWREFDEQPGISSQCCWRIMKEGVMWESLNKDNWKRNENMNVMDEGWRSYYWDEGCSCYLRRGMEGGMWGDCYRVSGKWWRKERNEWETIWKCLEDCERVEEMIIKGCERVIVKVLLRERNHEWEWWLCREWKEWIS